MLLWIRNNGLFIVVEQQNILYCFQTYRSTLVFGQSVGNFRPGLNEICIFQEILIKVSNIKFNENPYSRTQVLHMNTTDGHDESNKRPLRLC
jgi:hypothetical protein